MKSKKIIEIIENQIYCGDGSRANYIDISGEECKEFISAIVELMDNTEEQMEEIKVGEFVRIKQGYIGNVVNINNFREPSMKYAIDIQKNDFVFVGDDDIVNHSPNIIDLVEEGDYVNGENITKIKEDIEGKYLVDCFNNVIRNKDIEEVLTKEQFEQSSYRLEE